MLIVFAAGALIATAIVVTVQPTALGKVPHAVVPAAAVVAGIVTALADTAPTGWVVLDALLRFGFGAAVTLAAARTRPWCTLWFVGVALAVAGVADGPNEALAAMAAGLVVGLLLVGERSEPLRAVAVALALVPLARCDWHLMTGASSVAVAVAALPLLVGGFQVAPRRLRRSVGWAMAAAVLLGVVGSASGLAAALTARTDVDRAVQKAQAGLRSLDGDDRAKAQKQLDEAARDFRSAESSLRAWWARPALAVPVVAQQTRAVATMASAGRDLSETAASAVGKADIDAVRGAGGGVDLVALNAVAGPLRDAVSSLERAHRRLDGVASPVLLGPVADRLRDLTTRVANALKGARVAASAVDVAPGLLGADGPKRYFLALQTPSEMRGGGGFMGSWAEMEIDHGKFNLVRTGRVKELTEGGPAPAERRITGHDDFVNRYSQAPAQYWGVIGFSPDFPTVGSIISQLYPESGGRHIDGVVSIDPAAFAAFLDLTGPIDVPGYPQRLTTENAEKILLYEQYLAFPNGKGPNDTNDTRVEFLEQATHVLFDKLTGGKLPAPGALARSLGPAIRGRHIQLYATDASAQGFFKAIDATGTVRVADGDVFGITGQNYNGNKIDYFLDRKIAYDVTWDPATGAVNGSVEVTLSNRAPATGLPHSIIGWGGDVSAHQIPVADGENLMWLTTYTRTLGLTDATLDGKPLELSNVAEAGLRTRSGFISVPSGQTRTFRAKVAGVVPAGRDYAFTPVRQVAANPDEMQVTVRLALGWSVAGARDGKVDGSTVVARWSSEEANRLEIEAQRTNPTIFDRLRGT